MSDLLRRSMAEASTSINQALTDLFDEHMDKVSASEAHLYEAMKYVCLEGGKRLRPYLVITCSDLFDVDEEQAMRVAMAVELIHCYSLVHDDLPAMDNSDVRRGKNSCHKQYDEATAILVGDALQALAFEVLVSEKTSSDHKTRCKLVTELAKDIGASGMVAGQMLDLMNEHGELDISMINRLQMLKTGALIDFCGQAPALLGYANAEEKRALLAYTHNLGLAFQMTDDLLDHTGTVEVLGKDAGKDTKAGKATFVRLLGVEKTKFQVQVLCKQAIDHLEIFGNRAILLKELFHYIVNREC